MRRTLYPNISELVAAGITISGGDGPIDEPPAPETFTDVEETMLARAEALDAIDALLNTAAEADRSLTDDERTEHDQLVARADALEARAAVLGAEQYTGDARTAQELRRARTMPTFNINLGAAPVSADRSLDELLWATPEVVRAGTISQHGQFVPNRFGAEHNVEQVMLRSEGFEPAGLAPRMSDFTAEHQPIVQRFQRLVGDILIAGALVARKGTHDRHTLWEIGRSIPALSERWNHLMRAMDVDTSAEGGTWVPTGIGADLHAKVRAAGKIAPLFARIDLPTNPWKWPIEGADATAYRVAEPTSDTATKVGASTPGTVAATFDAEIFGARTLFSRSLEADSALAILPYARGKLVQAFVDAEEKAILDGDADGTHQDADVQAIGATDARTAWDGLRKRALANASASGGGNALTVADLRTARGAMGKWGLDPANLVYIVGVGSFYDLLGDTEVTSVEKYGARATILNGELARVNGVPVVVSEHVREDLNASGVQDGITTNLSYALAVNTMEWAIGQRMALDVEVDDSIYRETYQRVVVGFMREDFQNIGDASTNDDTSIIYNVT